jgi:glycosyltransferase involved in cell wall biosynthesis
MNYIYLIDPKNPNLKHCPVMFMEGLVTEFDREQITVSSLDRADFATSRYLIQKLITTKRSDTISVFFFATQLEYIFLMFALRCLSILLQRDLKIYHHMHEPKYEPGRANLKTSLLLYWCNFIISRLADRIILSSEQALIKAQEFIKPAQIAQINLVFSSHSSDDLKTNLIELSKSWDKLKTISSIGILAPDKNPEGFISLANVANQEYTNRTRFIRAGWDKKIKIDYHQEKIIHFPGYISNSGKKFLLNLTHIIVIPYHYSTQSGVIVEALSYGKILIVNDIPAFDRFRDLKSVFTIDFNDRAKLVTCLNQIFSMSVAEYESCYWESVNYFNKHNSVEYLREKLGDLIL